LRHLDYVVFADIKNIIILNDQNCKNLVGLKVWIWF